MRPICTEIILLYLPTALRSKAAKVMFSQASVILSTAGGGGGGGVSRDTERILRECILVIHNFGPNFRAKNFVASEQYF